MKALKYIILLGMLATVLESYAQTHTWIQNNGNTDWSTPSNWSAGTVPNATSEVLIPDGFEVEITAAANANSIFLEGSAQLIVSDDLTLQGGLDITLVSQLKYRDGTISGGIIENEGTIRFENPEIKLLSNTTVNNYNLMFFVDSNIVRIGDGTVINNTETGMMEMLANGGLTREGTTAATLNNYGSIRKYTENGNFGSFYMIFDCNNFGTIEIATDNQFLFISPQASLTNNENAMLIGEGFFDITSSFINDGHISPAGDENIGTLGFVNVLELSDISILDINITPTENDVIAMTGTVDLRGEIKLHIDPDNVAFQIGQVFTILTATNGIDSCNFPSQITVNDGGINDIVFNVFCDGNNLFLEVETILLSTQEVSNQNNLSLYPNPVSQNGNVTIEASAEILSGEAINIVVYDVLGNTIKYTPKITAQSATFNMEHVASGLYFVQVRDENLVVATRKLIVK